MLFPMVEGRGRRITWSFSTFDVSFVLNNSREFFFHFVLEQSRTKELVKEHTPFRGCGWRSKGEAETDALRNFDVCNV